MSLSMVIPGLFFQGGGGPVQGPGPDGLSLFISGRKPVQDFCNLFKGLFFINLLQPELMPDMNQGPHIPICYF